MDNTRTFINDLKPGTVAVIGLPSDEISSSMPGAALAPARIREALHSSATNLSAENGLDPSTNPRWRDIDDLNLPKGTAALGWIEAIIAGLLSRDV